MSPAARAWCSGLLAACLFFPHAGSAGEVAILKKTAIFERERASRDVRSVADWIVHAGDNRVGDTSVGDNRVGDDDMRPFVIIDKKDARVYVFDPAGRLLGAAPALLGVGRGDTALPGIGAQELSGIAPRHRVTQAGRFVAEIGTDSHGEDVLWLDYEGALAMHRVITTVPSQRREHRLATPTTLDNRISYGCINIPVKFYEQIVQPSFTGTKGIVYVLPESKPLRAVFASYGEYEAGRKSISRAAQRRASGIAR